MLVLVPLNRTAQTIFKVHKHLVSQMLLCLRDIGKRVLDVAGALGSILDLALIAGQRLQGGESLIEGDAASGGAVEDASRAL